MHLESMHTGTGKKNVSDCKDKEEMKIPWVAILSCCIKNMHTTRSHSVKSLISTKKKNGILLLYLFIESSLVGSIRKSVLASFQQLLSTMISMLPRNGRRGLSKLQHYYNYPSVYAQ